MIPPARTVGEALTNAHENITTYAHILAKKMAERAVRIAQEKPLDSSVRSPSLVAAAYIALSEIPVRALHLRLIPAAMRLIESHGAGHKIHDMDPQFWKLGNDSAVELICECLLQCGQDEVVRYIQESNIQRHILHDPIRIKLLDAGYTYSSVSSGSHHEMDTLWKGHDTRRTLPAPEGDETNNLGNRQIINSIIHVNFEGNIVPVIEADKIEEKSKCIIAYYPDKIVFHTRAQVKKLSKVRLTDDGNIDPEWVRDSYENRYEKRGDEDLRNEYTFPALLEIHELNPQTTVCDNGEKVG